jgi:4-hydroxy-3-polyprenylbenzoate decarboxylase
MGLPDSTAVTSRGLYFAADDFWKGGVMRRLVVAITGASGAIYGIRALEVLREVPDLETHLIVSSGGRTTIASESGWTLDRVRALADVVHRDADVGASIASGSFPATGMLVAPCSIKTLSGIANCYTDTLVARAADVMLKERRRLVLLVRETPLHTGHLRLMTQASESGAVIMPPVPAFYHRPQTIMEIVDQTIGRALDQFGIDAGIVRRWEGVASAGRHDVPALVPRAEREG